MGRKKGIYALYQGEEYITSGTIEEIAKERGVKPETIRFYTSKVYRNRTTEAAMRCINIT